MSVHIVFMFASLLATAFVYSSPHSPVNDEGCFEENIHYIGLPLNKPGGNNTYGPTGSAAGCQSLCQQTDGCGWFNWERKEDNCWLKTGKGNINREKPGGVTGPRICPTTTTTSTTTKTTSTDSTTTITTSTSITTTSTTTATTVVPIFSISGGPSANEGNIFYGGRHICDDDWNDAGAGLFCRMMGYLGGNATSESPYGRVSPDFSMDYVHCIGNETSLLDCNYSSKHNCLSSGRAGVNCSDVPYFSISGGPSANEGNIFYVGRPICDDDWNDTGAGVFCRMMGYLDGNATSESTYGRVSTDYSMNYVHCIGNESSLLDCSFSTQHFCDSSEGAGVICSVSEGSADNEGIVFHEEKFICDDEWKNSEAAVFIRMVDYVSCHVIILIDNVSKLIHHTKFM